MTTKRGLSLPQAAYDMAAARAEVAGISTPQWIAKAIRDRALREAGQEYARFIAQPEVAAELDGWRAIAEPARVQRWQDLDDAEQQAAA